jgi:hypothetical protein
MHSVRREPWVTMILIVLKIEPEAIAQAHEAPPRRAASSQASLGLK